MRYDEPRLVWTSLTTTHYIIFLLSQTGISKRDVITYS
jgi:hypothetical protein